MRCQYNFLCDSVFWDINLTWQTTEPTLTRCFQDTILTWIPAVFLCLSLFKLVRQVPVLIKCKASSGTATQRKTSGKKTAYLTFLSIVKYFGPLLLIISYASTLYSNWRTGETVALSSVSSYTLKIVTNVLVFFIQLHRNVKGKRTSDLLFSYWLVFFICSVLGYYASFISACSYCQRSESYVSFIASTTELLTALCEFLLACLQDYSPEKNSLPYSDITSYSSIVLGWLTPLILKGYKKELKFSDLCPIHPEIDVSECSKTCLTSTKQLGGRVPRLDLFLAKKFRKEILTIFLLSNISNGFRCMFPLFLYKILLFLQSSDPTWKGVIYASGIFISNILSILFLRQADNLSCFYGLQAKSTLIGFIYKKFFCISNESQKKYTTAQIVNLVAVDADKVYHAFKFIAFAMGSPMALIVTSVQLWQFLGPSSLLYILVLILVVATCIIFFRRVKNLQKCLLGLRDSRLKKISEIVNSIQTLKFFAWEPAFIKRVLLSRKDEMNILQSIAYNLSASYSFMMSCPVIAAVAIFCSYTYIAKGVLIPTTAFVSLATLYRTMYTLPYVPYFLSFYIDFMVSAKKICNFLASEEKAPHLSQPTDGDQSAVSFKNVTASWHSESEDSLKHISMAVEKGQLVAVIGTVGSGKSSLLSALLGEMNISSGKIHAQGTIAYVPQETWIRNTTLRKNITFARKCDEETFKTVVDACCLRPDINSFPAKEMTEIGERGVNLSGGQKQRISLARAVYQNRDIYILDDPLSSVDSHVASGIFKNVIGPNGVLKDKTRIFVTNNLQFLSQVDSIVVLSKGTITDQGSFEELVFRSQDVTRLILNSVNVPKTKCNTVSAETKVSKKDDVNLETSLNTDSDGRLIEKESVKTGRIGTGVYTILFKCMGPSFICIIPILLVCFRTCDIFSVVWLRMWTENYDETSRLKYASVYATFGFGYVLFYFLNNAMIFLASARIANKLFTRMLHSVVKAPMHVFDTTPGGRFLNRFGADVFILDNIYPQNMTSFLVNIGQILSTVVVICVHVPVFIAAVVPLILYFVYLHIAFSRSYRQLQRLDSVSRSPLCNHISESVTGLSSIRNFGLASKFFSKFCKKANLNLNTSFHVMALQKWVRTRADLSGEVMLLVVFILVVLDKDKFGVSVTGLIISYAATLTSCFGLAVQFASDVESNIIAAERLYEYSKLPQEKRWHCHPSPPPTWIDTGSIALVNYSTKYRDELDLVLQNLSVKISPGQKIGVIGRTGAGKSSLILAFFRILEKTSGIMSIDDVDTSTVGLHDLRKRLTIIPQNPVLFQGDLRSNLDPNKEYTDCDLWIALSQSHLKDTFQDGLSTSIAENGNNLSVGQQQLICLARALLRRSKILFLDEATASVDVTTDSLIQKTIRKDFAGCTVITIAHRINTILDYDRVFVMDKGTIAEEGCPSELLRQKNSLFYGFAEEAGIV